MLSKEGNPVEADEPSERGLLPSDPRRNGVPPRRAIMIVAAVQLILAALLGGAWLWASLWFSWGIIAMSDQMLADSTRLDQGTQSFARKHHAVFTALNRDTGNTARTLGLLLWLAAIVGPIATLIVLRRTPRET